ncbi:chromate transporter [Mycoplasma sp. NEAQ87857]|uniref:chromate transporter n=1 Tax=Mycoplasma sp. NEAQ87857 TaxID=2683967 RepID=UPI001316961D|nr:chromate transporter [Mycoplasma sp. NEAQ87857]QGZ97210.1 chromate transporter [Mycoplasma sp. NEAQ87857]
MLQPIEKQKKKNIWEVILFVIKVTFIGFGGGNALMPVIKKEVVDNKKWMSIEEFDNVVIVTNMLPGPSVIQTISYVCIYLFGKLKGALITLFAILPHVLVAFGLLLLFDKVPKQYISILSVGVLVSIIAFLIQFGLRYLKQAKQSLAWPIWLTIFLFASCYSLFIPAPYNLPVVAIVSVIAIYSIIYLIKKYKLKHNKGDK